VRSRYAIYRSAGVGETLPNDTDFGVSVMPLPDLDGHEVADLAAGMFGSQDELYIFRMRDSDNDGLDDNLDNCPGVTGPPEQAHNPQQLDADGDGVGDLCDVCPDVADPGQVDADSDGEGDACEPVEIQLVTTGTPLSPSWNLQLQCGGYDVTDVNGAIVLPAGATNPKTLTLNGASVGSSSVSGPGLTSPQRSDAIYFSASGNGAPDIGCARPSTCP
jgi:hypothetical protein